MQALAERTVTDCPIELLKLTVVGSSTDIEETCNVRIYFIVIKPLLLIINDEVIKSLPYIYIYIYIYLPLSSYKY